MLLARILEEKLASLYRAGAIHGGVFLGRGQEALSVSVGSNLRKGDIFAPLIRDQAGRMAFGDSHLGAMIPAVCGALMARRMRGETGVVGATCLGDGGTSTGAFHEGLNVAAVEKLPLVLVIANNQYAYSTPSNRQFACADLIDKAAGYGVASHRVDGTDLSACLAVLGVAVRAAREGGGPQMIVGDLLRLVGHGEHDDASYIDPRLKASPLGRDCVKVAESFSIEKGWATAEEIAAWRAEAKKEVDATAAKVRREVSPDPGDEEWSAISDTRLADNFLEA